MTKPTVGERTKEGDDSQSSGNEVGHGDGNRELKHVTFLSQGRKAKPSCFPL